jgi:hypothetical membrane protein
MMVTTVTRIAGKATTGTDASTRNAYVVRAGGQCAIAAIVIGLGSVQAAVAISPWFSWTANVLSDLGHPSRPSALLFNGGLILAGALYLEFVFGLSRALPATTLTRVALVLLAVGALFLAGVGIFPETTSVHSLMAYGYFFTYPPGIILFGIATRKVYPPLGPASWALAAVAFVFGVLVYTPGFPSAAGAELAASLTLAGWSALAGYWLLKGQLSAKPGAAMAPAAP